MRIHTLKISFIAIICLSLAGCLGLGSLKYRQVKVLKQEGFVLTDEGWTLGLPERLLFDFNDAEIKPENQKELIRLAQQLSKYNLHKLKIVGHTDDVGNADYNQKLSRTRADSVAQVFLHHGFQQNNLTIVGRGSSQPFVPNTSESNRAYNRRVAVIIIP